MTRRTLIIVLWALCSILLVIVVIMSIYLFRRLRRVKHLSYEMDSCSEEGESFFSGYRRLTVRELATEPAPGTHVSPCVVMLRLISSELTHTPECDILINLTFMDPHTANVPIARKAGRYVDSNHCRTQSDSVQLLGNDSLYSDIFLRYTRPLEFVMPGQYVIQAHTVYPKAEMVGTVHQFVFNIIAADHSPGRTSPGMPNTITIKDSANRYDSPPPPLAGRDSSLRGSYERQLSVYTPMEGGGAQAPPLPPDIIPESGSVTTQTLINVVPNGQPVEVDQLRYSVDGGEPAMLYTGPFTLALPVGAVHAARVTVRALAICGGVASAVAEATLAVQPASFSYHDPSIAAPSMQVRALDARLYFDERGNPPGARTCFELVYESEARRRVHFSEARCRPYAGVPIPLEENVAFIYAWTVDARRLRGGPSPSPSPPLALPEDAVDVEAEPGAPLRSVATVYDCARASVGQVKGSRQRLAGRGDRGLLPPPVLGVACAEVGLAFDDPPAGAVLAYTLNDREPALFDVDPPACAGDLGAGRPRRHSPSRRRSRAPSASRGGPPTPPPAAGDPGGLQTFLYQPGRQLRLTRLETRGVYVTARVFMPVYAAGEERGGARTRVGYRYGDLFRRGFFFGERE